jgi:hypothetical protein
VTAPRPDSCDGAVVLGMGRSGTSATTRSLIFAGYHAGSDEQLYAGNDANPVGFFERYSTAALNDEILAKLGGSWFAPPTPERVIEAQEWAGPRIRDLLEQLRAESGPRPLVVKDPRISFLMPLWWPLLEGVLHPVLVVRDPAEVGRSLLLSHGTPLPFALASWELNMRSLIAALNGSAVTVAPYGQMLGSPEVAVSVAACATAFLRPDLRTAVDPQAAPRAFEPELHRNRAAPTEHEQILNRPQEELWKLLRSLPPGNVMLAPAPAALEASPIAGEMVRAEASRVALNAERAAMRDELDAVQNERDELRSAQVALRSTIDRLEARCTDLDRRLATVTHSRSWALTAPLRALGRRARTWRGRLSDQLGLRHGP